MHDHLRPSFPVGGGELGALIRAFDWSKTDLGPIAGWPPTLRTATNIVLQSSAPLALLWGPGGLMIYNDAYSVIAGQRHPTLLGSKVLEGWAEVAEFNAHVLEVGLAGGTLSFRDQEMTLYRNNVAEQVWLDLNYGPILGEDDKPAGVLAIVVETTDRVKGSRLGAEAEARVRESEARFRHLADHSPVMVWVTEPDGYCSYLSESWYEFTGQPPADGLGFGWLDATHPEDRPRAEEAFISANASTGPFRIEYRLRRADGEYRWAIDAAAPRLDEDGRFLGYIGSVIDIHERRELEEHLQLVINELNHRVKNTLATIQAIGEQTFRNADDLPAAREKFTSRIMTLARANDLLTGQHWVGASLDDVVELAVGGFCKEEPHRCSVDGPAVRLAPKTALSLSMGLHELATNAMKHGAWSGHAGKAAITWRVDGAESDPVLHLEWRELGGPLVEAPTRRGFGSRLIQRGLAAELNGKAELRFEPEGLVCFIEAPLAPVEEA